MPHSSLFPKESCLSENFTNIAFGFITQAANPIFLQEGPMCFKFCPPTYKTGKASEDPHENVGFQL